MSSGCWPLQPRSGYMDMSGTTESVDGEECRYCHHNAVVPVLDKGIERKPTGGGNKFRRRCTACSRWAPMCSEDHYRNHAHPHVLPIDAEAGAEDSIVPLEDYDYGPEWAELAEKVGGPTASADAQNDTLGGPTASADAQNDTRIAMTDGGVPSEGPDADDEPEVNEFECPWCGARQTGEPEFCGECGAEYDW